MLGKKSKRELSALYCHIKLLKADSSVRFDRRNSQTQLLIYWRLSPKNSVALVRERTIPTERPPPVGEVSANFCG
jgi:hypothetical protein